MTTSTPQRPSEIPKDTLDRFLCLLAQFRASGLGHLEALQIHAFDELVVYLEL